MPLQIHRYGGMCFFMVLGVALCGCVKYMSLGKLFAGGNLLVDLLSTLSIDKALSGL